MWWRGLGNQDLLYWVDAWRVCPRCEETPLGKTAASRVTSCNGWCEEAHLATCGPLLRNQSLGLCVFLKFSHKMTSSYLVGTGSLRMPLYMMNATSLLKFIEPVSISLRQITVSSCSGLSSRRSVCITGTFLHIIVFEMPSPTNCFLFIQVNNHFSTSLGACKFLFLEDNNNNNNQQQQQKQKQKTNSWKYS